MDEKKAEKNNVHLEMRDLKQTELQKQRRERLRIRREKDRASRRTKKKLQEEKKRSSETEDHEKQHLATLKRLKRGNENEFERNLRLDNVVISKQLMLTEEDKRAKLENDAATKNGSGWPWRQTKKEKQDWRRWLEPHSSGWPWRQWKKEEQNRNGFDYLTHFFHRMSSLALKWEPFF